MPRIVYVNGRYVPEEEAKVSVFDRAFLFGDAVYEVTAVLGGRLVDFEPHLARLDRSLREIALVAPVSHEALLALHLELVRRNEIDEGIVALHWLSRAQLRHRAHQLRSPMVLRCVDDYLSGYRYPLDCLTYLEARHFQLDEPAFG